MAARKDITLSKAIGKNIKIFRKKRFPEHGGIGKCIAAFYGINESDVTDAQRVKWSKWERGAVTPEDKAQKQLAKFFDVSVTELRGESEQIPNISAINAGIANDVFLPDFVGFAAATDGGDEFIDDDSVDMFPIPAGVGMAKVHGHSMEPLARDGQRVFLRPALSPGEEPKNGDLVVVWTHAHGTTKRLFKRWGGWLRKTKGEDSADDELVLISVNPVDSVNVMEHVQRDEVAGFRIVAGVWYG